MAFDRTKIPRADLLRDAFPGESLDPEANGLRAVRCRLPRCQHKNGDAGPSLLVNPSTGYFECKVSGTKGRGWKALTQTFLGAERWSEVRALCMNGTGSDPTREERWSQLAPEAIWTARYGIAAELSALYLRSGRRYPSDPPSETAIGLWSGDTLMGIKFRLPHGAKWSDGRDQKYRLLKGDQPRGLVLLLDRAQPAATVVYCAGEKDALVAASHLDAQRWAPVCGCAGEGTLPKGIARALAGRDVVIALDPDHAGRAGAVALHGVLQGHARSVRIARLPEDEPPPGEARWDVAELTRVRGVEALERVLGEAGDLPAEWSGAVECVEAGAPQGAEGERDRRSQADALVELAEGMEFFHDPDEVPYALVTVSGRLRTIPVRSRSFLGLLASRYHEEEGKATGSSALSDAINVLAGRAQFVGDMHDVYVRIARLGSTLFLDLANDAGEVVEVTPRGWRILPESPVRFLRPRGLRALPRPVEGGSVEELRPLLNVPDETAWTLIKGWLVVALSGSGPFFVLVLQGEQGSAKSTAARLLRGLIDPGKAGLRTPPRDERDLAIAARNGWVVAFDNLSGLRLWLSDALCRLATGGGFGTRQLYSDDEERLFEFARPVVINGIDDMLSRADLADRSVVVQLPRVTEDRRRDEASIWAAFDALHARVLGALLDAVAVALRDLGRMNAVAFPRMADAAKWVMAAEPALMLRPGAFLAALEANRMEAVVQGLEADPLTDALRSFMASRPDWTGTAADLANELELVLIGKGAEAYVRSRAWPSEPSAFGKRLMRNASNLRCVGIEVERSRGTGGRRLLTITNRNGDGAVPPVPPAPAPRDRRLPGDRTPFAPAPGLSPATPPAATRGTGGTGGTGARGLSGDEEGEV